MGRWTQALKQSQETSGLTLVPRETDVLPEIRTVKSPSNTSIIETTYPDRYTKCAHCGAGMWWTEGDDYRCGKCGVPWSARAVADEIDESRSAVLDLARSYDWG